jgi:drug/metabolite transporter (DMT)-like permease
LLSGFGLGEALSLVCAVAFAGHLLVVARAAGTMPARRLGTLQIVFCAITMLVTLPVGGTPHFRAAPVVWVALGVTALFATALAFTVQSWAQARIPASHAALLFTLEPVFAWLFSLFFLGERLSLRALAGAGLILAGILLAELLPLVGTTEPENRAILPSAEL